MKKIIYAAVLCCIAPITFADCDQGNVYDDIACYEKELKANKTKLNQTYQQLFNSMDQDGKKILERAQKNWLSYKNSHCDELIAHVSMYSLGAGSRLIQLSCHAELIEDRIKQLKDLQ